MVTCGRSKTVCILTTVRTAPTCVYTETVPRRLQVTTVPVPRASSSQEIRIYLKCAFSSKIIPGVRQGLANACEVGPYGGHCGAKMILPVFRIHPVFGHPSSLSRHLQISSSTSIQLIETISYPVMVANFDVTVCFRRNTSLQFFGGPARAYRHLPRGARRVCRIVPLPLPPPSPPHSTITIHMYSHVHNSSAI
ncbi:hypothetical protein PENSPDRAFT_51622 [Peniophora sp. CONT]|nr:hypothetical protein PENSPDRAFT_51622 [Peniophora sp. CONT]